MKRYLLIDDEGKDPEGAVRLLREHGYSFAESSPEYPDEQRFTKFAIDHAFVEFMLLTPDMRIVYANDAASRALGYSREELTRMSISDINPWHPRPNGSVLSELWKHFRKTKHFKFESSHLTRDGRVYPVEVQSTYFEFEGKEYSCAFCQDISERKHMENVLRESEERFRTLAEKSPVGVYIVQDDIFRYVNPAFEEITGYTSENIIDKLGPVDFLTPEDRERILDGIEAITAGAEIESSHHEFHISRNDGSISVVEAFSSRASHQGRPAVIGTIIDITERKRWEEKLTHSLALQKRISEELQQASLVVENSPVVLFRWRAAPGWPVELVSHNVTQFGYTPEELLSGTIPFSSMIHPDDLEVVAAEVKDYSEKGVDSFQQEYRIVSKSGETRWVYDRTVVERDENGVIKHYQGIVIDITDRKLVEEELLESTERLQSIFRVAPIGIGVVKNRTILEVNRRFCEMTGYGQEEVLGMNSSMLYPSVEEYERVGLDKYRQITDRGSGIVETRWRKKDATNIDVLLASTPLDPSDLAKGVIFTALDITDRKRSVERMRSTLAEKVVLLQEVHHRVKNNLQIITSLLDLQSDYINEEASRRFIRESQNRIRSMALVHEQLYRSGDLSSIDFANYVDDLVSSLFVASVVDQERIGFQVDVLDVELDMDRAIPCGLIINELVSNAIKYAFPEGRRGAIRVACSRDSDGFISLRVSDNGVGLPKGLDFRSTETMGLQIVNLLTRQLQGKIETSAVDGTAFLIAFPGEAGGRRGDRSAVAGKS